MKKCEDDITKSYTFRFYALYKSVTISFCPQFADSPMHKEGSFLLPSVIRNGVAPPSLFADKRKATKPSSYNPSVSHQADSSLCTRAPCVGGGISVLGLSL